MSYRSRVYRQRNAHVHDESKKLPFFGKQGDANKSGGKNGFFQAKSNAHSSADSLEMEADSMAHAVVNHSPHGGVQKKEMSAAEKTKTPSEEEKRKDLVQKKEQSLKEDDKKIQKKEAVREEEEDEKKSQNVQAKTEPAARPVTNFRGKLNHSGGKPLPRKLLYEMNNSFSTDFSAVRIHDDAKANELSNEIHAQAFTYGNNVYFNKGKYNPENSSGKFLLAHELTHVVQQNAAGPAPSASIQRTIGDTLDLSSPRFKGDPDLEAVFDGEKVIRFGSRGEPVEKIQQALVDAGFPLPKFGADGIFGSETKSAVTEFQKQSGLVAGQQDGEVGEITLSRLDSRFTGGSAITTEKTCENGTKTITVDFAMMKGATGNPTADIATANRIFRPCCIAFTIGRQVTVPAFLSDLLLGDTDLRMGECNSISSEDLLTFLTVTSLFGLSAPVIAFYVDTLHRGTNRLGGNSVSPMCATGLRSPMEGMISIANGAGSRTFSHEIAHILMNTFSDHSVTEKNLQRNGPTGEEISPVQCAIMYTRAT